MTREEAIVVLKAFMDNPLFSDVHRATFSIAIHDIKQRREWDINKLMLVSKTEWEQEPTTKNDLAHNLCDSCTNIGCEFQSGIVRTECAFYMPPHLEPDNCGNYAVQGSTTKNDLGVTSGLENVNPIIDWNNCHTSEQLDSITTAKNDLGVDAISRKAVQTRLKEIINEMETIFADIREREVNDSVCGLCEYDCDHGLDGFANECPGFEKDDCFKLNEKYRAEWLDISNLPSVTPQEPKKWQYEKHTDHTDCIWYGSDSGCPVTCSQYRDGWNDAMDYIFKNGKGYQPYRHDG